MRLALGLVVVSGCGRIGFETVPTDGATGDAAFVVCHTGTWDTPTQIASTQSSSEENDPSLTADGLTLFFESNRTPSLARALWYATRPNTTATWGAPVYVAELDDATDDLEPDISPDGLSIRFTSLRGGLPSLFVARRTEPAAAFVLDGPFAITGDDASPRHGADLSDDGLQFYFGRDLDVAFATRDTPSGTFTFARELDEVNVPATDGNPSISSDGLELFFDTYRNGPAQIFRATRASRDDAFGVPEVISDLLPAGATEFGTPEISRDGRTLYYAVNDGVQIDLYTSTRTCD